MELIDNIWLGLSVAATPENLLLCLLGCLLGTVIGVLPGIGPLATMAMLLPVTFHLAPAGALIVLAGVYYGAQYGGSTTAILLNLPGEASAVVTCLDGHAMARQGRGGIALATAALSSLIAGCLTTVLIATAAPALANVALLFQYFQFTTAVRGQVGCAQAGGCSGSVDPGPWADERLWEVWPVAVPPAGQPIDINDVVGGPLGDVNDNYVRFQLSAGYAFQ